ncbi:MAG: hypothetical protein WBA99_17150, partial [Nodosilinea sp.]
YITLHQLDTGYMHLLRCSQKELLPQRYGVGYLYLIGCPRAVVSHSLAEHLYEFRQRLCFSIICLTHSFFLSVANRSTQRFRFLIPVSI